MRNRWMCLVFFLFCLIVSGLAEASDPRHPPLEKTPAAVDKDLSRLTLQDCLDIAFAGSRLRLISAESVKIAEAQYGQALSGHWPQVKFSMTGVRMDEDPTFLFPSQPLNLGAAGRPFAEAIANAQLAKMGITPDSVGLAAYNNALATATAEAMRGLSMASMPAYNVKLMDRDLLTSTLSLIYPLYTGGKVSSLTRQAKAGVDASKEEARRTDLQIVRDIKQYYYGYVFSKALHRLGRQTLERFAATESLTQEVYRHSSGRVKKTDYLRSKMMTAAVCSAVEMMKSNEELTRSALANTMGLPWNIPVDVAETDIPFSPFGRELDELVASAQTHNPQMNQVRLGLGAADAKISEARSGHLPVVAIFGNLTRLDNSYSGGLITDENRNSWQVGVSLELPIFNGFRTSKEVQEARLRHEKLRQESLLLSEGVALQVKNAFLQIARSQAQVQSGREALETAAENADLHIRAYAQGMVETREIIESQLMEFIMHGQYLKALYDHQVNQAHLDYLIGKSIHENH